MTFPEEDLFYYIWSTMKKIFRWKVRIVHYLDLLYFPTYDLNLASTFYWHLILYPGSFFPGMWFLSRNYKLIPISVLTFESPLVLLEYSCPNFIPLSSTPVLILYHWNLLLSWLLYPCHLLLSFLYYIPILISYPCPSLMS